MGRYTESVCKLCRREGVKLMLKGDRCFTTKCAIEKRNFAPGQHGKTSRKFSDYAVRLREKQKARRFYGMSEGQFHDFFVKASKRQGVLGINFLQLLESRLDNVIYRSGLAESRAEARQMIGHGHFFVNKRKVDIASFILKSNDVVSLRSGDHKKVLIQLEKIKDRSAPKWVNLNIDQKTLTFLSPPLRTEIEVPVQEQLIVEHYSKS